MDNKRKQHSLSDNKTKPKKQPIWIDNKRYVLKDGKYGWFFYDIEMEKSMPLKRILGLLNRYCLFACKEIEIEGNRGCYFCKHFYKKDIKCNLGHIHLPKENCKDFPIRD